MLRLLRRFLKPLTFRENNLNSMVILDIDCFKDRIFSSCSTRTKQSNTKV